MRKALPFVLLLVFFFAISAKADVTGSFDIHAALFPEGTQTESVQHYFDIQSNLQLSITISGMTFGADLGFGTTGSEFAVTGFNTNLGAVNVNDTFVFAVPFYSAGVYDGTDIPQISPTLDANDQPNGLAFVRKQVRTDMFIGGFVLSNLAIFEDVDFPNPFGAYPVDPPYYHVGQINSKVGDQTPTYGFGDVLTVRGQTVSGLTIESTVGICASKEAKIVKKRAFQYKVNKACTATLGNIFGEADAIEGGAKTPLLFEFEEIAIRNIEIGGVRFTLNALWLPTEGISQSNLSARFSLLDFATVSARASFAELTPLTLKSFVVTVNSDVLTLNLGDTDADLAFDRLSAVFSATLNPNQNPATLQAVITNFVDQGITTLSGTLSINRGPLRFSSTTAFSPGPPDIDGDSTVNGEDDDADGDGDPNDTDPTPFGALPGDPAVTWSSTSLSLDYFANENVSLSLQATATSMGLMPISLSFGIVF